MVTSSSTITARSGGPGCFASSSLGVCGASQAQPDSGRWSSRCAVRRMSLRSWSVRWRSIPGLTCRTPIPSTTVRPPAKRPDRLPERPGTGPQVRIGFRRSSTDHPLPELFHLLHRHTEVNRIFLLLAIVLAGCGALAAGTYTVHGLFLVVLPMGAGARVRENLPPLAIQISR